MRQSVLALGLALLAGACSDFPTGTVSHPPTGTGAAQGNPRFIVRFRDTEPNASGEADRLVAIHSGRLAFKYSAAIKGFAAEFSAQDVAALAREGSVLSVEADQVAHAVGTQPNPPSWGLDRIDQSLLPLSSSYTYGASGTGVRVYIIDTGIRFTHVDFGGRAVAGVDAITSGGTASDCNGHGTHVAGTVGGATYGVAKGVALVAVRVLDCSGSGLYSQVIAGVDWVTQQKQANPSLPMVANMSLGGPVSSALNASVANAITAGVVFAVAAGNDSTDACNSSPASAPTALTVAATTISDARAGYSNLGTCVDLFAPGSSITSDYYTSNTATATGSGTSMASPHVAGAAALYLELNTAASPATVAAALLNNATPNVVGNPGTGSPNRLLYTGFIGTVSPPVASFTFNCTYLNCSFDGSGSTAQGNATYTWAWGDGTANGSGKTASHSYAAAGSYNVALTVGDAGGSNSKTQAVTVTAPPPGNQPPVSRPVATCVGMTCTFDGRGSTDDVGITAYEWYPGGPAIISSQPVFTFTFGAAKTRTWTLVVRDGGGLSNSANVTFTVPGSGTPAPVASFTFSCTQLACSFDGSGSTAQSNATYTWAWGDGTTNGSGKTASHNFGAPGGYPVTLTVSDAGGTNSRTQTVTASPPPPVGSFTFTCSYLNCSFDGTGSTAQSNATYTWGWGDGTANGSGKTASHTFGAPGSYMVTLTVNDAGGSNSVSQTVTVTAPPPVANFTYACTQLSCSFDGGGSTAQGNATYTWSWGDGTANGSGKTSSHGFALAGTYPVTLTVSDAGGTASKSQSVTVSSTPPGNQAPVSRPTVTCHGLTCTFDGTASTDDVGITAYEWYPGGPAIFSTQPAFSFTFSSGRTRTWTLTVRDGGGLSNTASVTFTTPAP